MWAAHSFHPAAANEPKTVSALIFRHCSLDSENTSVKISGRPCAPHIVLKGCSVTGHEGKLHSCSGSSHL